MLKTLLKSGLSLGLLCGAAWPVLADNANLKKFIYKVDQTPTVLHVRSTDGVTWNKLKDGNVFIHAKIVVDTNWPGFVKQRGVGIVLGNCVGAACLEQPRVSAQVHAASRDFEDDPVVVAVPTSKFLEADRLSILEQCNEHLTVNGPTTAHTFEYDMDSTLVVDTGEKHGVLNGGVVQAAVVFDEDGNPVVVLDNDQILELFFPNEINHWKAKSFKIHVSCDPVASPVVDNVTVDYGEFKVTDMDLFLSTATNADSQPNPATTCKKGQIKVRLKTSKPGLAHFRLWKKVGNAPASFTNIAAQAQSDGDGGFQAEHVEWVSVDKTSTLQAKAEDLGDPNGQVTGWKDLLLLCKAVGEGGGIAPDMSDYEAIGSLNIFAASGTQCPRAGQIGLTFTSNYNQPIDYGVTCTNNINVSGTLNPSKVGDDWKAQDTIQFPITKTEGMGCTLWHHRNGNKSIAAIATGDFACSYGAIVGPGTGGLKPDELPGTDRPKTDWQGTVTVSNTAPSNACPRRADKVIFDVARAVPGSFSYYLGCTNGDFFDGTLAPAKSGEVYRALAAHSINVSKTRKIQCTLQEVKPGGAKVTVATGENQFNCAPGPVAGTGSGQLALPQNDPTGGGTSGDTEAIPPAQLRGELKFVDGRGTACPRDAKIVVGFKHSQTLFDAMHYTLDCNSENGRIDRTGVASPLPSSQGGFYAPRDEAFVLEKTGTYSCKLTAGPVPVESNYKAYASASHTFVCARPPVATGGGGKVAPSKPDTDNARAERLRKAKIAKERQRRAKAAARQRAEAERLRKVKAAAKRKSEAERRKRAKAAEEGRKRAKAAAERRKRTKAAAERRKRAKAAAERRRRAKAAGERRRRAKAQAAKRRKARAAAQRRKSLKAKAQRRRALRSKRKRRVTP